jgi:chromosome partitioning protein
MQTIAVMNYKGGVAKTTTTIELAGTMVQQGKRVLLIDVDGQASMTYSLMPYGREEYPGLDAMIESKLNPSAAKEFDIRDVLQFNLEVDKMIQALAIHTKEKLGYIDLVPANFNLIKIDAQVYQQVKPRKMKEMVVLLRDALEVVNDQYDYCLIDCPPNFNFMTQMSLYASDHVLIPSKYDNLSKVGIVQMIKNSYDMMLNYGKQLHFLGVFFTLVKVRQSRTSGEIEPTNNARELIETVQLLSKQSKESKSPYAFDVFDAMLYEHDQYRKELSTPVSMSPLIERVSKNQFTTFARMKKYLLEKGIQRATKTEDRVVFFAERFNHLFDEIESKIRDYQWQKLEEVLDDND